ASAEAASLMPARDPLNAVKSPVRLLVNWATSGTPTLGIATVGAVDVDVGRRNSAQRTSARSASPPTGSSQRNAEEPACWAPLAAVRTADPAAAIPGKSDNEKPEGKPSAMLAFCSLSMLVNPCGLRVLPANRPAMPPRTKGIK